MFPLDAITFLVTVCGTVFSANSVRDQTLDIDCEVRPATSAFRSDSLRHFKLVCGAVVDVYYGVHYCSGTAIVGHCQVVLGTN